MQRLLGVFCILCWVILGGCNDAPETRAVSGTVTLDGKPLDDAVVEFDHSDGSMPTTLDISAGKFSGHVLLGNKTLRFFAMRPSKPNPRLGSTDAQAPFENILPDRYGYDSTTKLSIESEDLMDLNYELTSK